MADLNRRVEIIFEATDRVSNSLTSIENATDGVVSKLAGTSTALLRTEAAAAALGVAFLTLAVNESAKFQAAQADLRKALDDTDPSVESFTESVDALSVRFGQAGDVIIGGIANFRNAGFTAQESAELIEQALNLQIAGDLPLEEAFTQLQQTILGFRVEVEQVPRVLEALNNITQASGTNIRDLGSNLSVVAAQARLSGLSIEETLGFIAPINEVFAGATEAGTALSIALGRLSDSSKPVRDGLADLGIDQLVEGQLRPAGELLRDVAAAFGELDDQQKLTFATQLFGQEQAKRLVIALSDLERTTELTNVALEQTGSVSREVDIRLASFNTRIDVLGVSFSNFTRVVGDQLRPSLSGAADGFTDIFVVVSRLVSEGRLDSLFSAATPQIEAFTQALEDIAANLPEAIDRVNFDSLLDSFSGLSAEIGQIFNNLFGDIDVSTPEGLARSLQRVVDTITGLNNVVGGIISQFQVVFATLGQIVNESSGLSDETQRNIGQLLGAASLIQDLGLRLGALALILNQNRDAIDNVIDVLAGGLGLAINALQVSFDLLAGSLVSIVLQFARLADAIPGIDLSDSVRNLNDFANAIDQNLQRNAVEAANALRQVGEGFGLVGDESEQAARKVPGVVSPIRDAAEASGDAAREIGLTAEEVVKLGDGSVVAGGKITRLVDPTEKAADATKALADSTGPALINIREVGDAAGPAGQNLGRFGDFTEKTVQAFSGLNRNLEPTRGTFSVIGNAASAASGDLEKASEASDNLRTSLAQIASDERIRNLEIAVEFNIAQVEADTERFKASIEGLNEIFADTGDILSDALGPLSGLAEAGTSEFTAGFQLIQEIIDEQNRIRQQIADAEVRNLNAQTDLIDERVRQARRGDALIRIEAPPEIEEVLNVVFQTITNNIQVRANDQGLEILNTSTP